MPSGAAQEKLPFTLLPKVAQPFSAASTAIPEIARSGAECVNQALTTWHP